MTRPDAAALLVVGTAVVLAVGDVHCHRRRKRMVTDVLRRPVPLLVLAAVFFHALDVLGRLDPFRAVARLIPVRA